jgi:hypothetical protein
VVSSHFWGRGVFGYAESESVVDLLIPVSDPDFGYRNSASRKFKRTGVFGYGKSDSGVGFLIPISDPDFGYRNSATRKLRELS